MKFSMKEYQALKAIIGSVILVIALSIVVRALIVDAYYRGRIDCAKEQIMSDEK